MLPPNSISFLWYSLKIRKICPFQDIRLPRIASSFPKPLCDIERILIDVDMHYVHSTIPKAGPAWPSVKCMGLNGVFEWSHTDMKYARQA
uniref:AlNc14C205G8788 protein n=1 Tax=Albugo laibachii Nc14 TaxID=890382 RepID=F0WQX8_9STRA|nr:AlNc14C205G8788 [Albugo laibachii Nc14]|eukprot:CCA23738.1 AlNc14C205G8788 [Albugo laibachii Nc14]